MRIDFKVDRLGGYEKGSSAVSTAQARGVGTVLSGARGTGEVLPTVARPRTAKLAAVGPGWIGEPASAWQYEGTR